MVSILRIRILCDISSFENSLILVLHQPRMRQPQARIGVLSMADGEGPALAHAKAAQAVANEDRHSYNRNRRDRAHDVLHARGARVRGVRFILEHKTTAANGSLQVERRRRADGGSLYRTRSAVPREERLTRLSISR
jgi:hypothetical protein